MGHVPSKQELIAIIRRVDTDGDGIKSQYSIVNSFGSMAPQAKPTRNFMAGNIGHIKPQL